MAGRQDDDYSDAPVAVPVQHLGRDQLALVEIALSAEGVEHRIAGSYVLVRPAFLPAAERVISRIEAAVDENDPLFFHPPEPDDRAHAAGIPVASRLHRLSGGVVDVILVQFSTAFAVLVGVSPWIMLAFDAMYWIIPTAVSGRTLGKVVANTRVTRRSGGRPSVLASIIRYAVVGAGAWTAQALGDSASDTVVVLLALWPVVVYLPLLFDAQRRGLHDRAALTVVVEERRRHPR